MVITLEAVSNLTMVKKVFSITEFALIYLVA